LTYRPVQLGAFNVLRVKHAIDAYEPIGLGKE
jgi:hypothetical protein